MVAVWKCPPRGCLKVNFDASVNVVGFAGTRIVSSKGQELCRRGPCYYCRVLRGRLVVGVDGGFGHALGYVPRGPVGVLPCSP